MWERVGRLDVLINNAGRPGPASRTLSADGHEITFQTNYLAPVALTTGLLFTLEQAGRARVINVASATHYSARLSLDDLELEHDYSSVSAYAHSKLALVTYTCWLARHIDSARVEAVSLHPGVISTGLLHSMFGAGGDSVEHGAWNIVSLARRAPGANGVYFDEDAPARANPEALEVTNQERLMKATARALRAARVPAPPDLAVSSCGAALARAEAGAGSRVRWVDGPSVMRPACLCLPGPATRSVGLAGAPHTAGSAKVLARNGASIPR